MKIYITGLKASGKSYIIDLLRERYDNSHLQGVIIFDFEQFCSYKDKKYYTPEDVLESLCKYSTHAVISGSKIENTDMFDTIFFIDIQYGVWKSQMTHRLENGRINSKFSHKSDKEYANFTPVQFDDYKREKISYYEGKKNFKLITLNELSKFIIKNLDKIVE